MTPAPLPRLRHPVVLAHGLLGFSRIALGAAGASYFRGIPERFAAAGVRVLAPAVPPTGSVERRAEALRNAVRAAFGDARVHVVAHSMGGLDARHAITHLGLAAQVVSLVTLGTPHRGSPVADRATDTARRANLFDVLRALGADPAAFDDLRTSACAAFSARTPDVPGVRYASFAGRKPRPALAAVLRATGDLIADDPGPAGGENDGLVAVASARWGEACDVVEADHLDLVGWTPPAPSPYGHPADVAGLWDAVAARLAAWEDEGG